MGPWGRGGPDHPACPSGQPAEDTHSSGHKGACLGRDAHLPRLHPSGCWAQDPAVRLEPGPRGNRVEWGAGLTWAATRLCVCEDPRLRPRRRRVPPLGELRVPLRKLVPNQARSFSVCLEKRRLVSRGGAQGGALGASNLVVGELERGGAGREAWAVTGQGDRALCSSRPRGRSAWTHPGACPCMRCVGQWN